MRSVLLFFPLLINEFGQLGIEITPRYAVSFTQWIERLSTGEIQASLDELFAWHDPVVGIHRLYESKTPNVRSNVGQYRNTTAERLLLAAASELHVEKRRNLYADFQHIVENDHPILWIATTDIELLRQSDILGLDELGLGILSPLDSVTKSGSGSERKQP